MPENGFHTTDAVWCLIGGADAKNRPLHVKVSSTPFQVGRHPSTNLCLNTRSVSATHAELVSDGHGLWVRDLKSTNGTYVNGKRIAEATQLNEGDFVQFAQLVFRICRVATISNAYTAHADTCDQALALIQFDKLMNDRNVVPYLQPIVGVGDGAAIGYEVLIRSKLFGLQDPGSMFLAASALELEAEFSRMCRTEGVRASRQFDEPPKLFLNTHPTELADVQKLYCSLRELRDDYPDQRIAVEIHEAAVTRPETMREMHAVLRDLDMSLAYDDFGAGQARLIELADVPPDYLKFDMKLIQGIHEASAARQQMLATLVRMARDMGIATLAEGVEEVAEGKVCQEIGFDLGQGYLWGRPAPVSRFVRRGVHPAESDPVQAGA